MTTSRSSATRVILTPAQMRRLEAVGWPVGDLPLAEWLTVRAEVAAPNGEAASIHKLRAELAEERREVERLGEILAAAGQTGTRIAWERHDGAPCLVVTGPADMEEEIAAAAAEAWDAMMGLIAMVARDQARSDVDDLSPPTPSPADPALLAAGNRELCRQLDAQRTMVLELRGERAELRAEVDRLRRVLAEEDYGTALDEPGTGLPRDLNGDPYCPDCRESPEACQCCWACGSDPCACDEVHDD